MNRTHFRKARCAIAALATLVACAAQMRVESADDPNDVIIEGDHLMIMRPINFAFDSDEFLSSSGELLDHVALLLSHHEEITRLEIVGHTDVAGGPAHNQELSERRAAAVVSALQERKVTQELVSSGVGETEPVCSEDTDDCHARNRRVEFKISLE